MPRQELLYQWTDRVTSRMPTLSPCQARVLALWSFGMMLCRRCSLSAVALALSDVLDRPENTLRQRLREHYLDADGKRGRGRKQLDASVCFAPLLRWAVGDAERVALAIDVTNLGDRFHVLTVAVLCRGGAVPVAWAVLPGGAPGAWNVHWRRLLGCVTDALQPGPLGSGRTVVVLSDRGLESAALYEAIVAAGFHPLMRLKSGGTFRPNGWKRFHRLERFAPAVGGRYRFDGELYHSVRLRCQLLACRAEGCESPWLLATDLDSAEAGWYAFRAWVEQGFKDVKSDGWQCERTRMVDPARLERHWVAVALATLWALEAGAAADPIEPPDWRPHSLFAKGLSVILAGLLRGRLVTGRLPDDPWPEPPDRPKHLNKHEFEHRHDTYP